MNARLQYLPQGRRKLTQLRLWPWRFDLYVVRLFLSSYVLCAVTFVGLFIVVEAFSKLDRFLRQDGSLLGSLFRYYVAMVPTVFANLMAPVLTLAATMFTLTTLIRQNELTPIKASGVSVYRVLAPIFLLAVLFAAGSFVVQEKFIPRFKDPIRSALALSRARALTPPAYYDQQHGYLISVQEYSTTQKIAQGVEVSERHENGMPKRQIDVHRMEWKSEPAGKDGHERGIWVLRDGSIQTWDEEGNLLVNASASNFERLKTSFREMEFETTMLPIDLETSDLEISYLSSGDLRRQYRRQPYHKHLAVKLHHHFAFPFAHVILLLLGVPFVLRFESRSPFVSLFVCFLICALFFFVTSISMSIATHSEFFSPILAAWFPVMLFGSVGITLFDRLPT